MALLASPTAGGAAATASHRFAWVRPAPRRWMAAIVAVLLFAAACETTLADFNTGMAEINADRAAAGRAPVVGNVNLSAEADAWAQSMRASCRLSHRSNLWKGTPAGSTMVAENVGVISVSHTTHAAAIAALQNVFMASPAHAGNIRNSQFTHAGVGVVEGSCGITGSAKELWVVQIFVRI